MIEDRKYLIKGCVVKITTMFDPEFTAEVLNIEKRYGKINRGRTSQKPLLQIRNLNTGEIRRYDESFVTEVLSYPPQSKVKLSPVNKVRINPIELHCCDTARRNVKAGPLLELTTLALSKLRLRVDFPIDVTRLISLYEKQKVGLIIRLNDWLYYVHWDKFSKWVKKNVYKITYDKTSFDKKSTESNTRWEKELEMDYDDMNYNDMDYYDDDMDF